MSEQWQAFAARYYAIRHTHVITDVLGGACKMPVPARGGADEPFALEAWCQMELSRLLKFPVGDDLVR